MPLFTDRPLRSTAGVAAALTVAYVISSMTSSMQAFHLTQTSVAILAISSLLFLVTMHHRREGHLLTQSQEEMVLIGGFGLFFMGEGLERLAFHLRLQRQYSLPVSSSYPFTKLRCWLGAVRKQEVSLQAPLERSGCLQPRGAADEILASRVERDRIPVRPTMFTV
ncbi:hypothetical protein EYR36_005942 [Pleurotus pulmonarius]|nr:hypothetical protein EYR36_005942 [Pleurotus pulmonarius]KAF4600649.1 hypothetical protein EYR38_005292 [Pleurotus pulmonarius]